MRDRVNTRLWQRRGHYLLVRISLFFGVWVMLFTVEVGLGQWRLTQQGHLTDANRRVGSLGLNPTASPDAIFPRVNLMMTGNVRGGSSFQGSMNYGSVGEFNPSLGSSMLSDFRRDSTGASDLSIGLTTHMRPYFDTSRSVTGVWGGRVMRSDQVFAPINTTVRSNLSRTGSFSSEGLPTGPINRRVLSGESSSMGLPAGLGGASLPSGFKPSGYFPAVINLGIQPLPVNQAAPLSPTNMPLQPRDMRIQPETQLAGTEDLGDIHQLQQRLDNQKSQDTAAQQQQTGEVNPLTPQRLLFNRHQSTTMGVTGGSNPIDRKVFSGGGLALQRSTSFLTSGKSLGSIGPTGLTPPKSGVTVQGPPVGSEPLDYGRQLMQKQRYYQAVAVFDIAIQNNPSGGAGYLSKGHAQIAAGAFVSAADSINQAFVRDPELGLTKIALSELFGDPALLPQRLSELERLQKQTQNPSMLFLQGYILYQLGLAERAQEALIEAQQKLPDLTGIELLLKAIS